VTSEPRPARRERLSFSNLSRFALEHLLLLPLGAAIALVWANTAAESYYRVTFAIAFAVNDVAMAFFFALMTKEVVEATAPHGVLHPARRAWLPVIASIGAAVVPALLYIYAVDIFLEEPMLSVGWPVTLATDLAVSYFTARLIFGLHPAIPLLLLLGISSDALGFLALALFNPLQERHFLAGGLTIVVAIILAFGLRRAGVKSFWPYIVVAGSVSWYGFYFGGLQPALALVPIVPFLPHAARDPGFFVDAESSARDALSQFDVFWRYPVQVALFFFGLVNAGVPLHALEPGTWGVPIAVLVGKPVGTLVGVGAALAVGLHLPHRIGWREILVVSFTAAIGFSFGLFIATALLPAGQLRSETSMGVLLTLLGIPLAFLTASVLRVGRFGSGTQTE